MRGLYALFASSVAVLILAAACGSSEESQFKDGDGPDSSTTEGPSPPPLGPSDSGLDPDATTSPIHIEPADPTVTFTTGFAPPTVNFVAKTANGAQVPASFTIDRGEIGSVELRTGVFGATGNVGGKAKITATYNGNVTSTSVTVNLKVLQNGFVAGDAGVEDGGGAGGNGGVGGEGPGGPVSPAVQAVLAKTPVADPGLTALYPYDKTVWPRGLLAPLMQWKPGAQGDYDAVRIRMKEAGFEYDGTFSKVGTTFINHPIPQQAWKQMTQSNGGDEVEVSLVFAKGTTAYGPVTMKWKIAPAPLKGTVYYNSYGTKLASNFSGAKPSNGAFGGATLAIKGGSTSPSLVAGNDTYQSGCRVCHSVAANGSSLITQRGLGSERKFSTYDLKSNSEIEMAPAGGGSGGAANYAWPAIYPDGTLFVGDSSNADGSSTVPNRLFRMVAPDAGPVTPIEITGTDWPAGFRAAFPAFSPDGKAIAFTMYAGATGADTRTLGFMPFNKATSKFGALKPLYNPPDPAHSALYPAFLPTNDGIIFHVETRYNGHDYGGTRSDQDVDWPAVNAGRGSRAHLWWVTSLNGTPVAAELKNLNGNTYLPTDAANGHEADWELNYEPTVNPVPSGGYAWVVFTSRRLYGNVATINPFRSDPRFNDLTSTPTPKKLWVAAIDLNAAPGTDPSHPAFYLPAQELLAGNSRGYWVVDPCKSDGNDCETGDECCGGYCRPNGQNKLVCSNVVPSCAQEFEKCSVSSDCCNAALRCINGRCAVPLPK